MKKALLIIDVQKYEENFICKNKNNIESYQLFSQNINSNIEKYTKNNDLVIYIREEFPNWFFYRNIFPRRSLKGSDEVLIADSIIQKSDIEFTKMFPSAFTNKKLKKYLKKNNIDTIEINGMDAGCGCAYFTAIDSAKLGYKTIYNTNCLSTSWPEKLDSAKIKLDNYDIEIIGSLTDMFVFSNQ